MALESEIRIDSEGRIWEHSISRKGKVSQSAARITREEAEAQVAAGTSRWETVAVPKGPTEHDRIRAAAKRGDLRVYYSEEQIAEAVRQGVISASDALNQDA